MDAIEPTLGFAALVRGLRDGWHPRLPDRLPACFRCARARTRRNRMRPRCWWSATPFCSWPCWSARDLRLRRTQMEHAGCRHRAGRAVCARPVRSHGRRRCAMVRPDSSHWSAFKSWRSRPWRKSRGRPSQPCRNYREIPAMPVKIKLGLSLVVVLVAAIAAYYQHRSGTRPHPVRCCVPRILHDLRDVAVSRGQARGIRRRRSARHNRLDRPARGAVPGNTEYTSIGQSRRAYAR